MADPESGFHVVNEDGNGQPKDTAAVAKAKEKHRQLFQQIAERNRWESLRQRW